MTAAHRPDPGHATMKTISKSDFTEIVEKLVIPACLEKGLVGPFVVLAVSPEGGRYANWRVELSGEIRMMSDFSDGSPLLTIPVNVLAVGDGGLTLSMEFHGGKFLVVTDKPC